MLGALPLSIKKDAQGSTFDIAVEGKSGAAAAVL